MIKALRWKLVLVTMALLMVVLVAVVWLFIDSTYEGMEDDSLLALKLSGNHYGLHGVHDDEEGPGGAESDELPPAPPGEQLPERPGPNEPPDQKEQRGVVGGKDSDRKPQEVIPCFVVGYDHDGQFYAKGPGYYDLTDQSELEQMFQEAQQTGEEHGLLTERKLRFLRLDEVCGDAYAFTDVAAELESLTRLLQKCIFISILAILGFFIICMLMSRWATRPVERVMEQQRQFVADASHELKTPLTVILTNAELLEGEEYSPEEKKKFSGNILTMSKQMRGLVEELLDLARVNNSTQELPKEPVNLSDLVQECALLFEPIYFEAGRELQSRIDDNLQLRGNQERLRQVLDILLDNGCKYSLPGSTVKLKLQRSGIKRCLITVESQGDTLTRQECRDIFKRFYRRDTSRSMNHSYGLGLAIARTIIRQHRGRIWAKSQNGVNTFYVCLPIGGNKR